LAVALLGAVGVNSLAQVPSVRDPAEEKKIFESYFPDSNDGGEKLDEWWKNKTNEQRPAEEALQIIRAGFRRTSYNRAQIAGWAGRYVRHAEPDLRNNAIDLLYHASFSPGGHVRHFAVYYGLSGAQEKSAQVLDRLAALAMSNESVDRIVWGVAYTNQGCRFGFT